MSANPIADAAKERLSHPLGGPFIWAFCVVNWELPIWIVGAVAKPDLAYSGIQSWIKASSYINILIWPGLWWALYVFAGPFAVAKYQMVLMKARGESPVPASLFNRAIDAYEKMCLSVSNSSTAFKSQLEAMGRVRPQTTPDIQSEGQQHLRLLTDVRNWVTEANNNNPQAILERLALDQKGTIELLKKHRSDSF